jgi:hypothetical protein
MEKIKTITCDKCSSIFITGNRPDGTPNGVGFQLQNGRLINLCAECISKIGRLKEAGDEAGLKEFFDDLGVEV